MNSYGIFDVIGPVMIGPSSSHTAGAVKIGQMARQIFNKEVVKADFYLHGSFKETYKGHGTDIALLSGVMNMKPDDVRIPEAFEIAKQKGIISHFIPTDLGDVHPNTVKIKLFSRDGDLIEVTGSSVGGGKIMISRINTFDVEIDGEYPTIITKHYDRPGMIAKISAILSQENVNIAFMKVFRHIKGEKARLIVQIDDTVEEQVIESIEGIEGIVECKFVESLKLE